MSQITQMNANAGCLGVPAPNARRRALPSKSSRGLPRSGLSRSIAHANCQSPRQLGATLLYYRLYVWVIRPCVGGIRDQMVLLKVNGARSVT